MLGRTPGTRSNGTESIGSDRSCQSEDGSRGSERKLHLNECMQLVMQKKMNKEWLREKSL